MPDWRRYCRTREFDVRGHTVRVTFPSQRSQKVRVEETDDGYRLESTVMGSSSVETLLANGTGTDEQALSLRLLIRNRSAPLVGFKWTQDNRILAESHIPAAGLSESEFRLYLRTIAQEADRLEHLLTGQDEN